MISPKFLLWLEENKDYVIKMLLFEHSDKLLDMWREFKEDEESEK